MKLSLPESKIKELLLNRYELLNVIQQCKKSINEISLNTIRTISLTDLKNNIDFDKYPELEYLFTDENLKYLRPYKGQLMHLEDTELGIASLDLVKYEISLLTGIDLFNDSTLPKAYNNAMKFLQSQGVKTPHMTQFANLLNTSTFFANNIKSYNLNSQYPRLLDNLFYNANENYLIIKGDDVKEIFTERLTIYDVIDLFSVLKQDIVISNTIPNDIFIDEVKNISLRECIEIYLNILKENPNDYLYDDIFLKNQDKTMEEIVLFVETIFDDIKEKQSYNHIDLATSLIYEFYDKLPHYVIEEIAEIDDIIEEMKYESCYGYDELY